MRLRWAETLMIGQSFACLLAAFCFYIYISSVHVIIYKKCSPSGLAKHQPLYNVLAAYFCKICIQLAASRMQISFSQPLAGCKFHSVGLHLDENFIQSAASRMQIASGQQPCNTKYPICMRLATNQMKFASCWLAASRMQIFQK